MKRKDCMSFRCNPLSKNRKAEFSLMICYIVSLVLLTGCVTNEKYKKEYSSLNGNSEKSIIYSKKRFEKIAIVTEMINNWSTDFKISANCVGYRKKKNGNYRKTTVLGHGTFKITLESDEVKFLLNEFKTLFGKEFERIVVFNNFNDIVDFSEFLFIVIPYVDNAIFDYNKHSSENRKINYRTMKSSPLEISAQLSLGLKIVDEHMKPLDKFISNSSRETQSIHQTLCNWLFLTDTAGSAMSDSGPLGVLGFALGIRDSRPFIAITSSDLLERIFKDATDRLFISSNQKILQIAKSKSEEHALPSALTLDIKFSDEDSLEPNGVLDAGESAEILVTIINRGEGTGYGTVINVSSDDSNVSMEREIHLNDIPPGEKVAAKVKVKANLDIADQVVPIKITCHEKRGYDSKQYQLNIPTARLKKPEIVITNFKLNDGVTGLANGNGNGIPENGETIELIAFIKNKGVGDALKAELQLDKINPGVEIIRQKDLIDRIAPGQTVMANLSFAIPSTYFGKSLDIRLSAKDVRGASDSVRELSLDTQIRRPLLVLSHRIIDYNKNGLLENGEEAELEIVPINKGQFEAREVTIMVKSNDIELAKTSERIARIAAGDQYTPLRFAFKVPRITEKENIAIEIALSQKDFSGVQDTIVQDLRITKPDFAISSQILDQGNPNGQLDEGEVADIVVRITNTGNLDAQNVNLKLKVGAGGFIQEGVRLLNSRNDAFIGKIAASQQSPPIPFSIFIQRGSTKAIRNLNLRFDIEQKDFSGKILALDLKIHKDQAEVINVARQTGSQRVPVLTYTPANSPPVIAIGSLYDNQRVVQANESLRGTVADDRGVAAIEILINGRNIESDRDIGIRAKGGGNQKQVPFDRLVPLQVGKNIITVRAYDLENLSSEHSITVYRESERGEIYAAVIGINQYKHKHIPALRYARKDAKAFYGYLRANLGILEDNILKLYDHDATASAIRSTIGTRLRRLARRPEDTVIIYYAGHGAPDNDEYSQDGDGITKYILSFEADPKDLVSTAIPMWEMDRLFNRIKAERLIFIADSCFSGASGGRTIVDMGVRTGVLSDGYLEKLSRGKGRVILTSSSPNEVSEESDKYGHGLFTYYLLKGLRGDANVDGDNYIDVHEISRYLKVKVSAETEGRQNPVMKTDSEGLVILGRIN